jgi:hypothetical protein
MYTKFSTDVAAYNKLKTTYNEKLTEEKTRNTKVSSSYFTAAIVLPDRPCPPDQPPAFSGLTMYWVATPVFSAF